MSLNDSNTSNDQITQQSSHSQTESATHLSVIPLPPPPSYNEASLASSITYPSLHPFEISHRFPPGLFVLRNRSSLKVLDVSGANTEAGTPIIAYNPKRPTLVNDDLFHKENNQLFFLDWHGCLCSVSSGLRVDVQDNKLVLSKPQPVLPKPTRESHPPVQFKYDPITRTISVVFLHDFTYTDLKIENVNSVDYLLEVQPQSNSSGASSSGASFPLEKLSEWFPFGKPVNSAKNRASATISEPISTAANDDDPLGKQDPDLDDSPNPAREIHVISLAPGWREKFPSSDAPEARKWLKRQWDIASIVVQAVEPLTSSGSRHFSSTTGGVPGTENPMSMLTDLSEALDDLRNEFFRAFKI